MQHRLVVEHVGDLTNRVAHGGLGAAGEGLRVSLAVHLSAGGHVVQTELHDDGLRFHADFTLYEGTSTGGAPGVPGNRLTGGGAGIDPRVDDVEDHGPLEILAQHLVHQTGVLCRGRPGNECWQPHLDRGTGALPDLEHHILILRGGG